MKSKFHKIFILSAGIIAFASCKPKLTLPTASKGRMDPSRYVAVGNSITSGFADGALYYNGQLVSYPNLLAGQFRLIGGVNFNQPLMPSSSVGVGSTGNAPFILGNSTDCLGVTSLGPIPAAASGDLSALATNIFASQGPFNNMGVPGAKAITVLAPGYGNPANGTGFYNPFFARMASASTASILSDALLINPTFFTLFIGNNDVLVYAMNGGAADSITPPTGMAGVGFDGSINAIVNALTANGAKGVIGNIPDITALPFFTTIPWNGLTLRQGQADTLNSVWQDFSTGKPLYNFHADSNAFLIADPTVPFLGQRQIKKGEFILLNTPLDSIKCYKMGTLKPIPNLHVLDSAEIAKVKTAIIAYNNIIKSVALAKGLALVDVNAFMNKTNKGIVYNGIAMNTKFVTGGAFSLDGIHLNPIGNAMLANEFIKSINATFGSTIPQVDATKYRGAVFP